MEKSFSIFIERLVSENPNLAGVLNAPAEGRDIAHLEKTVGISLPKDFSAALKLGNGQNGNIPGIFDGHRFLCIDEILSDWNVLKMLSEEGDFDDERSRPESGIKKRWWNPHWIPFTNNGFGDHFCLDMDPSSEGALGQVIFVWHDAPGRSLVSNDFSAWLSKLSTSKGK